MKTRESQRITILSVLCIFFMFLSAGISVNAQEDGTKKYQELEQLQDENMDYLKKIYKITKDYPAFSYKYKLEDGEVKNVKVTGVENELDKKRLEVILFDLKSNKNKMKNTQNRIGVFYSVDKEARPEEGREELMNDIRANLEFPEQAKEYGVEGIVYVKFVVDENGKIPFITAHEDIEATSDSFVKDLRKEAIAAVKKTSGEWEPAKVDGVDVASLAVVPIRFDFRKDPTIPVLIQ